MQKINILLFYIISPILALSSMVIQDGCSRADCGFGAGIDPFTKKSVPLRIYGRSNEASNAPSYTMVEMGQDEFFSSKYNVTIDRQRFTPESFRLSMDSIIVSSLSPDIILWQKVPENGAADITNLAQKLNWSSIFAPSMMKKVTFNNIVRGMPERYTFWGFYYHPSVFDLLQLKVPTTWKEFIYTCQVLKANNYVAISMWTNDLWMPLMYFTYFGMRVGGSVWWSRLIAGQVNLETDAIAEKIMGYLSDLIPFFPSATEMAAMKFADARTKWIAKEHGMIFSSQTVWSQGNSSDNDFFQFPLFIQSAQSTDVDVGEVSSYNAYFMSQGAKNVPMAEEWFKYASTANYWIQGLASPGLHRPAHLAVKSASDSISAVLSKGYAMLEKNNVTIFGPTDVEITDWANAIKPYLCSFILQEVNSTDRMTILSSMEQLRLELVLKSVSEPIVSISSGTYFETLYIELESPSPNTTIQYMIIQNDDTTDNNVLLTFTNTIILDVGHTYRIRAFASREGTKNSGTVEATYIIIDNNRIIVGTTAKVSISWLIFFAGLATAVVNSFITVLMLEHLRDRRQKLFWLGLAGIIRVLGCVWPSALMIYSSIRTPLGYEELRFDMLPIACMVLSITGCNTILIGLTSNEKRLMIVSPSSTSTQQSSNSIYSSTDEKEKYTLKEKEKDADDVVEKRFITDSPKKSVNLLKTIDSPIKSVNPVNLANSPNSRNSQTCLTNAIVNTNEQVEKEKEKEQVEKEKEKINAKRNHQRNKYSKYPFGCNLIRYSAIPCGFLISIDGLIIQGLFNAASENIITDWFACILTDILMVFLYTICWSFIMRLSESKKRYGAAACLGVGSSIQFVADASTKHVIYMTGLSAGETGYTLLLMGVGLAIPICILALVIHAGKMRYTRAFLDESLTRMNLEMNQRNVTIRNLVLELEKRENALTLIRYTCPYRIDYKRDMSPTGLIMPFVGGDVAIDVMNNEVKRIHSPILKPIVPISSLMKHPVCMELLKWYANEIKILESFEFLIQVQRYQKQPTEELSKKIYNTYILASSPMNVNTSGLIYNKIESGLKSSNPSPKLFDAAHDDVYKMLVSNHEMSLQKSHIVSLYHSFVWNTNPLDALTNSTPS